MKKSNLLLGLLLLTASIVRSDIQDSTIFADIEYKDTKSVNCWLNRKPDFDVLNDQGQSVLIKAVLQGNKRLVNQLLKKGVNVNVIDNLGKTALDYAIEKNNKKLVLKLAKSKAMVTTQQNLADVRTVITTKARWMKILSSMFLLPIKMIGIFALVAIPVTLMLAPVLPMMAAMFGAVLGGAGLATSAQMVLLSTGIVATSGLVAGVPCAVSATSWYDRQAWYTPSLITQNIAVIR